MPRRIQIVLDGGTVLEAQLDDSAAAAQLLAALPLDLEMSRWGDEYYGSLPMPLAAAGRKRDVFEVGALALWPPGNAFCIFFGPTPASRGTEPRMASPGIPLGKVVSGAAALGKFGASLRATLRASPGKAAARIG